MTQDEIISAIYGRLQAAGFFGEHPCEVIELVFPKKKYQLNVKATLTDEMGRSTGETVRLRIEATKSGKAAFRISYGKNMIEVKFRYGTGSEDFSDLYDLLGDVIHAAMGYSSRICHGCECGQRKD